MIRRVMVAAVVVVVGVLAAGTAIADVATPRPQWTKVQMESETVNIAVSDARVSVEATFHMRNHGKAGPVVMGYPLGEFEDKLNQFAVSVDGAAVKAVRDKARPAGPGPGPSRAVGGRGHGGAAEAYRFEGPYRSWKVWTVPMKAGKTHVVKVTYWVTPAKLADAKQRPLRHYTYTLVTGATWKGKIKEAVVNVKLQGTDAGRLVRAAPNDYVATKGNRTMTWRFHDFKPTHNIDITWRAEAAGAKAAVSSVHQTAVR